MLKGILTAAVSLTVIGSSDCRQVFAAEKEGNGVSNIAPGGSPAIAAGKNEHIYVVYEGAGKGTKLPDIFFSRSTDGARSWSVPGHVCTTNGISSDPDIAVESNGAIDVVWSDTTVGDKTPDIYFARSTDEGTTWSKPVDISKSPGASLVPAIATAPDNSIHVVWQDKTTGEQSPDIFYVSSPDPGKAWPAPVNVSRTPGASSDPVIDVGSDGVIHVAWADTSSGEDRPDIYYDRFSQGSWATPEDVSNTPRISSFPAIACGSESHINLCWSDNSKKEHAADIWCAIAGKRGHFAKPLNISSTSGVSSQPAIAADKAGRVAIVWSDTSNASSRPDIFVRVSLDGAKDFSAVSDVSNAAERAIHPDVCLVGPRMFVVWEDATGKRRMLKVSHSELQEVPSRPAEKVDANIHEHGS